MLNLHMIRNVGTNDEQLQKRTIFAYASWEGFEGLGSLPKDLFDTVKYTIEQTECTGGLSLRWVHMS